MPLNKKIRIYTVIKKLARMHSTENSEKQNGGTPKCNYLLSYFLVFKSNELVGQDILLPNSICRDHVPVQKVNYTQKLVNNFEIL